MVELRSDEGRRALAERLMLSALREQDLARIALEDGVRGRFLAAVSRELAQSLDESATRAAVARRTLPRGDSWCIVDIIELDGAVRRLAVSHPDPSKQVEAQAFADRWFSTSRGKGGRDSIGAGSDAVPEQDEIAGGHGVRRTLVVPLAVRGSVLGAITFVIPENDPPFSPDEFALASNVADLCALALDNARLYREAEVLRDSADFANRAKSTFLSNMSHELMTPLNAIGGYVTLLEMGLHGPTTPEQQIDLSRIRQNQAHLLALISAILGHARSEDGRMEYRYGEVPVQPMLAEVVAMLQAVVDERQVTLSHQPGAADEVVWADADHVRQILLNLVMNALKYGKAPHGTITLESTPGPETIAIHVTDDGAGIPEDQLGAIFHPFVQLKTGLNERRGGVGLGLAISRDLARAMNGDLTAASSAGAGARFTLELPRARRPWTDSA